MVCLECREGDHAHCYDTKHPQQDYPGCACQHLPRENLTGSENDG